MHSTVSRPIRAFARAWKGQGPFCLHSMRDHVDWTVIICAQSHIYLFLLVQFSLNLKLCSRQIQYSDYPCRVRASERSPSGIPQPAYGVKRIFSRPQRVFSFFPSYMSLFWPMR